MTRVEGPGAFGGSLVPLAGPLEDTAGFTLPADAKASMRKFLSSYPPEKSSLTKYLSKSKRGMATGIEALSRPFILSGTQISGAG